MHASQAARRHQAYALYPFRYRDPVSGKWRRARHVANRHEIAAQNVQWEIIGPPEIRDVDPEADYFHPYPIVPHAEIKRLQEPSTQISPYLEQPPAIDGVERFLVSVFPRRYVAYCARRRRFAQMQGAARLYREVAMCGEPA